jgi:FKBP-type peptidyl-prolyl cis-trans isomerase FkpA
MTMKKTLILFLLFAVIAGACKKDDENEQIAIDDAIIRQYLSDNDIAATEHESGIYYIIHKEGTGGHPNLSHNVVVDYKGYLIDGTVFDESVNAVELKLALMITGFQIGVNLLKPGGSGTFFIPSTLGYGDVGKGDIPPNSVLIFEVVLVEYF